MKLYLTANPSADTPTAGDKSTANAKYTLGANNAGTGMADLALSTTIGTSSSGGSHSRSSDATTATRTNFMGRWTSPRLVAATFGSGTWTFGVGLVESNSNADSLTSLSIYIWRPSTSSVVGYIYDSSTDLGTEWATATSSGGKVYTVSGSNVTCQLGDVLVLEVFRNTDSDGQSMSTSYSQLIYYHGGTEPTAGSSIGANDTASYLDSPATITFATFSASQAAFRFYADGTESGSTALDSQDTNVSVNADSNAQFALRIRLQETGGVSGPVTDDYQLSVYKNGAGPTLVGLLTEIVSYNSANLTDGGATTNRLGSGGGSFVAGKVSDADGQVDNLSLTASNYTELLYSLEVVSSEVANGDTYDFIVLRNGTGITYSITPRLTVVKTAAVDEGVPYVGAGYY